MLSVEDYCLRKLKEQDREQILRWRNSDRIRANMYTDHIIAPTEHRIWFDRVTRDESVIYLLFEYRQRPTGLVYFTDIDRENGKCMWGFYLSETDLPRGSGTVMGYLAMNHIFEEKKMRKVCGEVLDFNAASQKFFKRLGFTEEGRLRQHVLKNGNYVDVVLFSLFSHAWCSSHRILVEEMLQGNR
jgi:UDP-4-amino-4,6-dideoxy-N-acetyl-beta-L-altrosamine N-acetyltransferase